MPSISMKELLEAGVHFGHQTKRWNPKMKEYIFGERNGIYIVDLQKTLKLFKDAMRFVAEQAALGKNVLFVGTKRQAQEAVAEEAGRCGQYYINQRWLGGLLTNFSTVQRSIKRLKELEAMAAEGSWEGRAKKEVGRLERERKHLDQNLAGIKDMPGLPDLMFVIDSNKEAIAVKEARKLSIPVVAVVDTNCDPDEVDWVIPGNDDALRAIRLFTTKVADAVVEGRQLATEQDFRPEKVVTDETPAQEEFTQYAHFDPNQLDELMSESLSDEDLPSMSLPRKGPGTETPAAEPVTTTRGEV
ncbi:MAG TPA: 30S ribosomal protein S2 [Bryobacteraceae bacterium]|nr:30S ribosomal protein S2 [Bryobacteraceae bacterium]